ncbi:hypothetical protein GCM10007938_16100 [Vibrio zhanjiangensis]|uniref:Type III secretion protein n=1 Tax=Vibrio zhanjiangensis TaxID=1046128 RepID=A0ABQ6EZE0_9VIBR|nr:hypothetical protein [Vibrio zhanjiangensis]GLT17832.1 hypothetical protein GCM10007938_16100 [Vibrio zhanjiangensis]
MVDSISPVASAYTMPQQPVSRASLESLFDKHIQEPVKPMGEDWLEGAVSFSSKVDKHYNETLTRATEDLSVVDYGNLHSEINSLVLNTLTSATFVGKFTQGFDKLLSSQ